MGKKRQGYFWRDWDFERILDLRICDLNLKLGRCPINQVFQSVCKELRDKEIVFVPHVWLSDEFFCPDGIPGIAIPFYLAHPKLIQLEKKMMLEAEGSNRREATRILRHEMGHSIEHAYFLNRKKQRIVTFGKTTLKYPESYVPKPFSKSYVLNLENWYAQSHPDEDFAETFAVWLNPHSHWKSRYAKWPAIKKLNCINVLMKEIQGRRPLNRSKTKVDPVERIKKTLREYYEEKRERYGLDMPATFYDRDLRRVFSDSDEHRKMKFAHRFIRKHRRDIRKSVSFWTGQYQYAVDQVIEELETRCRELELKLMFDESKTLSDLMMMVAVHAMNHRYEGGYQIVL
ncbi:MAG: hypothetical protein KDD48_06540 [Bdellovibrionales bacterium]|nr:hypothetical protein [Bdellovibrionales bacterium]